MTSTVAFFFASFIFNILLEKLTSSLGYLFPDHKSLNTHSRGTTDPNKDKHFLRISSFPCRHHRKQIQMEYRFLYLKFKLNEKKKLKCVFTFIWNILSSRSNYLPNLSSPPTTGCAGWPRLPAVPLGTRLHIAVCLILCRTITESFILFLVYALSKCILSSRIWKR